MTSNTGTILVFPRIQPFGSDDFSSLGKVYSRQATYTVNCENSAVSRDLFVRAFPLVLCTFAIKFLVRELQSKVQVIHQRTCRHKQWVRIVLPKQVSLFLHGRLCILHTILYCSVNTDLISKNNCAKNSFNRSLISTEVY